MCISGACWLNGSQEASGGSFEAFLGLGWLNGSQEAFGGLFCACLGLGWLNGFQEARGVSVCVFTCRACRSSRYLLLSSSKKCVFRAFCGILAS